MNKRILLAVLFAPFLAYGGLKAYLWYGIKSTVDDTVKKMSPFVEIKYGGIFSTLEGEVGIENIVIQPVMTNDQFTVDSMSIRSESIFDFVNPEQRFKDGKFPKHVGWEVKGLNLDLDSTIFQMISDSQSRAEQGQSSSKATLFERADALGCGDLRAARRGAAPAGAERAALCRHGGAAGRLRAGGSLAAPAAAARRSGRPPRADGSPAGVSPLRRLPLLGADLRRGRAGRTSLRHHRLTPAPAPRQARPAPS